ncbi:3-deoxy-D-manno-octulosonic acid kinase [Succinivibrio dextrinosolvens]|uniref:3-deoxy-D-manno-octulosonic acid kinase n=1 Tax=Succinivibrio dextrinosolvens TaxID=83771 RepID=A0A662Z6B0_9GAMM|nr:3-deoxy-D-manno-octulosonic acid kinase [Succinivibrio dextrinosolvens]SFJ78599.1 3-deoxy-D-manno-octulosonic acid kinase [Succinivibrio dextrinosolvens]
MLRKQYLEKRSIGILVVKSMENIRVIKFGKTKFYLNEELPSDREFSFYESFFDRTSIEKSEGVSSRGGRGQTLLFTKDRRDLVLRHYKRGGLFGKLVSDFFFCFEPHSHRAYDEFALLNRMLVMNLPVPKPVIAREIFNGIGVVQDIVIERLNGYTDLSYVIAERHLSQEEFISIGRTLKRFFDNNILHTDLNIRNILINDTGKVCVIDFDKCFLVPLTNSKKEEMISRLLRSFRKEVERYSDKKVNFNESDFELLKQEALKN